MKRLRLAIVLLALLGLVTMGLHYSIIPVAQTTPLAEMTHETEGLYSGEISSAWPLRLNKDALDQLETITIGGDTLERVATRSSLLPPEAQAGFYLRRQKLLINPGEAALGQPEPAVTITLPIKLSENIYKVLLSLAAFLLIAAMFRDGAIALLKGPSKAMAWVFAGSLAIVLGGFALLALAKGFAIWLGLGFIVCGLLGAVASLLRAGEVANGRRSRSRELATSCILVAASTFLSFAAIEGYLGLADDRFVESMAEETAGKANVRQNWFELPDEVAARALSRAQALTLPKAWEREPIALAGATSAYNWHAALHVHDANGFRRLNGPFAEKKQDTFRIMVVGDSLTYGYGVEEQWTYSRLLESALQEHYGVEVINLGRSGYQSTDILDVTKTFAPQLTPDLIVYGVCLNDFLPSGQGEYAGGSFPLPEDWKEYLLERTELAKLVNDGYHSLLLTAGLKNDFLDDILSQDTGYRERFARDIAEMNRFAEQNGLPPVIGIVFHQYLTGNQRAWELIESAEAGMAAAGFDLISIKPWRTKPEGKKNFPVSRWEGHPNELAHSMVAEALYERLISGGYLAGYETAPGKAPGGRAENANWPARIASQQPPRRVHMQ